MNNVDFHFIQTDKLPVERRKMGYSDMSDATFLVDVTKDKSNELLAYKFANESDIVIIGSAPKKYIKNRLKHNKGITFVYSERFIKKNDYKKNIKKLYYKFIKENFHSKNYYLLCSSAFAAYDYNSIGLFNDKAYKWGYFPEVKKYTNINNILDNKEKKTILWVARFLDWKHPEVPIEIAKRLKEDGYDFTINMIGVGEMFNQISILINRYNLEDNVKLLGSMPTEDVRKYMEKSKIFLFTSDMGEGWGAVLNESMNSGCAVIASHKIGAAPFLIKDNKNGLIYEDGNIEDLYNKVKLLLDNDQLSKRLGLEAYYTMISLWNPKEAANRLIELSESLLNNDKFNKYKDGPCSKAEMLKDNWYNYSSLIEEGDQKK